MKLLKANMIENKVIIGSFYLLFTSFIKIKCFELSIQFNKGFAIIGWKSFLCLNNFKATLSIKKGVFKDYATKMQSIKKKENQLKNNYYYKGYREMSMKEKFTYMSIPWKCLGVIFLWRLFYLSFTFPCIPALKF